MLLKPNSSKWAKAHKGRVSPLWYTSQSALHGPFVLIALQSARLKAAHISAIQLAVKRILLKNGTLSWRVFPHIPASSKPAEVRMGKGKGSNAFWYTRISPGQILLEISSSNPHLAAAALKTASSKLPFLSHSFSSL